MGGWAGGAGKAGAEGRVALSHVDRRGRVKMVDVGDKPVTQREAVATGSIAMSREARRLVRSGAVKKGDPLQAARIAGILAAKQTSALIPLCHPLPLSSVQVELQCMLPCKKPIDSQLKPLRLVPSHSSPGSRISLPHPKATHSEVS